MVFVLTPLLFLVVMLVGVLVAMRGWSTRAPAQFVSCAECRYLVEFAPSQHCPECGADLLSVGVVTPQMGRTARRPQRTVVAVATAFVLAGIAALVAVLVTTELSPPQYNEERAMLVFRPGSGAYQTAEVRIDGRARGNVMTYSEVCFRIEHHNGTWSQQACFPIAEPEFHVERLDDRSSASTTASLPSITPEPGDPPGAYPIVKPTDVPIEDLRQWADSIGLDVTNPEVRGELEDLIRLATKAIDTEGEGMTRYILTHFRPDQTRGYIHERYTTPGYNRKLCMTA